MRFLLDGGSSCCVLALECFIYGLMLWEEALGDDDGLIWKCQAAHVCNVIPSLYLLGGPRAGKQIVPIRSSVGRFLRC